jgi:hypothetical protein
MGTSVTRLVVADNLRDLLDGCGWSEHQLARRARIAQKTINNVLNRRSACSIETLDALARPFGLAGWHLMIRDLPAAIADAPGKFTLVDDWLASDPDGRNLIALLARRGRCD